MRPGRSPRDLAAVVAGLGPGPFTGLRVGLVTAAVLSDTLGIPAYGVCSLDAIAAECADAAGSADSADGAELLVVTDARRREVYWARYSAGAALRRAGRRPAGRGAHRGGHGGCRRGRGPLRLRRTADPRCCTRRRAVWPRWRGGRIRSSAPGEVLAPLYLRRPDAVANPVVKAGDAVSVDAPAAFEVVPMTVAHIETLMPFEREMFGTEAWTANGYRTELADTRRRHYVAAVAPGAGLLGWAGVLVIGESAEILTVGVVADCPPPWHRPGTAAGAAGRGRSPARDRGLPRGARRQRRRPGAVHLRRFRRGGPPAGVLRRRPGRCGGDAP